MPFRYLDDIAIADVAFEAMGNTLEELFEAAAKATNEVMVDTKQISPQVARKVSLRHEDITGLLYDFLSEIVFFKDSEGLLFSVYEININKSNGEYELTATLKGEKINPQRQELRSDVKAVTYHMLKVEPSSEGWKATVILDI